MARFIKISQKESEEECTLPAVHIFLHVLLRELKQVLLSCRCEVDSSWRHNKMSPGQKLLQPHIADSIYFVQCAINRVSAAVCVSRPSYVAGVCVSLRQQMK